MSELTVWNLLQSSLSENKWPRMAKVGAKPNGRIGGGEHGRLAMYSWSPLILRKHDYARIIKSAGFQNLTLNVKS